MSVTAKYGFVKIPLNSMNYPTLMDQFMDDVDSAIQPAGWTINGNNIYNSNSGNVGIGIASPVSKLDVAQGNCRRIHKYIPTVVSDYRYHYIKLFKLLSGNDSSITLSGRVSAFRWNDNSATTTSEVQICHGYNGSLSFSQVGLDRYFKLVLLNDGGVDYVALHVPYTAAGVYAFYLDLVVYNTASTSDLILELYESLTSDHTTEYTESAITTSGKVGIGTTSPTYQLQLSTDSAAKPSTNTWTVASDERLKQDIQLADLDMCYNTIKSLPLKRYTWKDSVYTTEQVADRSKLGWIAQDVQSIFPKSTEVHKFEGVETTELNNKGKVVIVDCLSLNADQIYATMYGALQKAILKIEQLEAKVAVLESKI